MTFEDYLKSCANSKQNNPEWRMGQTYFNVLDAIRPDLAEGLRSTINLDPFYRDENIGEFLAYVCEHWERHA